MVWSGFKFDEGTTDEGVSVVRINKSATGFAPTSCFLVCLSGTLGDHELHSTTGSIMETGLCYVFYGVGLTFSGPRVAFSEFPHQWLHPFKY